MYEYQKRANTSNYIKINTNNNYISQKPQRFRDIYINQSPTFYNQIRYDIDNNIPNMNQVQYVYKQRRPFEYYSNDNKYDSFNNSLKTSKAKNNYFFNEFDYIKNKVDNEGSFAQKAVNTMVSSNPGRINKIYYFENKRTKNNSQDNKNIVSFNKPFENNSYNEMKRKNKLYIENPILKNGKYERKIKVERNKNLANTIAQKICNIVIQGEGKKDKNKKHKDKNKSQKSSENKNNYKNLDINKVQPKNLNLNEINNNIEIENQEQDEENENENENEEIEEKEEKEGSYQNENEKYFVKEGSNEEYEEEENNNNNTNEDYNNETQKDKDDISKEKDEQYEEELDEQEEQAEEEDENNINENREDIEEIEEDEQIQKTNKNSENKVKKNILYKLQKETEVELNGINQQINNKQLNIIRDDNIEIHGMKKPKIYEINTESNIALINRRNKPIIEIEKVQNYEQPRDYQRRSNKKKNLKIAKDIDNNVNIIHEKIPEPIYQIEKIQNFNQERNKERRSDKKRNKIKKYKITKLTDGNLFIEKTEPKEPLFEVQRIHEFSQLNKKDKKLEKNGMNNNMNKLIIETIEDAKFILEKIINEPKDEIQIQKVDEFFQKRSKEKKVIPNKKRKYRLKISKQNECNVEIITKQAIVISKLENIEIKSKYPSKKKKITNYKKLKKSKQDIYQYKSPEIKSNQIYIPKETRFIFKGKPKRASIRRRNSIKKEVVYTYKSPMIPKKPTLSIGGTITNTIKPTLNSDKTELEHNIGKIISPENSFITKGEIEINSSQNQIIGASPEKQENNIKYNSNTYPINNNNNNSNSNKNQPESNQNEMITISLKGEKKTFSKKYISPRRLRLSLGGLKEDHGNKKITDFIQSMNNEDKNSINKESKHSSAEMKNEEKNDNKRNTNVYYSSSFRQQKKEKNRALDNNALFISARSSSSSSQNNKNKENNKNDIQNNMNRIVINSSNTSPIVLKNFESSRLKTVPNDVNKINLDSEIEVKKEEKEKEDKKVQVQTENKEESNDKNINNDNKNEQISMTSAKNNEINKNNSYNFLDNYNNIDSQELSEYTKAYLNSYMSAARPELSDFSKEFLNSNVTNPSPTKPELSNITRAYLFSQNENNEEK